MIIYHQDTYQDDTVTLSTLSPAFRSGVGFFETLLYNGRRLCHLELHRERLHASLRQAGIPFVTAAFSDIVQELIRLNGFMGMEARVNIFYPLLAAGEPASPIVTAVPYQRKKDKTYRLRLSTSPIQSSLHAHKAMGNMFTFLERRNAQSSGFDDALLVDPSGCVLETTIASLLFDDGENLVTPRSEHLLPGTALSLASEDLSIIQRPVTPSELSGFRHAYVLNSLIGALPVQAIDTTIYRYDWKTCRRITDIVCPRGSDPTTRS